MKKTLITLLGIVLFGAAVARREACGRYDGAVCRRADAPHDPRREDRPAQPAQCGRHHHGSGQEQRHRREDPPAARWAVCSISRGWRRSATCSCIAVEESRLGIPLIFGMDVIHGYETTFPIPLGLTATWDMEAVERAARISAVEASAAGICWTFSPMVDIARDPRWGRASEGIGEDPFLAALWRGRSSTAIRGVIRCILPPTRSWDA